LNLEEYETFTNTVCALASQKHNGIHLIAIDAAADYIIDTNDLKDSRRIIKYFIDLSIKHQCPVIIITHLNPFTQKEMGHFGSVLQRKCYGLLTIDKQGEISTLSAKMVRKAGNSDVPPISFKYSKEQGYHVQVDSVDIDQEKVQKDRLKHLELAKKVFKPLVALQYKDAVSAIMKETSKGERTAKTMISNMSGWGYVKKFNDGFYRINNEEVQ
jgi:hypothetical protein